MHFPVPLGSYTEIRFSIAQRIGTFSGRGCARATDGEPAVAGSALKNIAIIAITNIVVILLLLLLSLLL